MGDGEGLFSCWTQIHPSLSKVSWSCCFTTAIETELIRWVVSLSPGSARLQVKISCSPLLQRRLSGQSMLNSFSKRNKPWLRAVAVDVGEGSLDGKREGSFLTVRH